MAAHPCFKEAYQVRLHERIVVQYVEADHALAAQSRPEASLQLTAMHLFHDEDYVGPEHQLGRERVLGVTIGARRVDLQITPAGEHLLGRRAAQTVPAADEQDRSDASTTQASTSTRRAR